MPYPLTRRAAAQLAAACMLGLPVAGRAAATRPRLAFVSHAPDSDTWWTPIRNAIRQASDDWDVDVDYLNPKDGSLQGMVAILDGLSPPRYDGVVSTLADYRTLSPVLRKITGARGLPLITVNSGTGAESALVGALVHIGQPEELAGLEAGRQARKAGITQFVCLNH